MPDLVSAVRDESAVTVSPELVLDAMDAMRGATDSDGSGETTGNSCVEQLDAVSELVWMHAWR